MASQEAALAVEHVEAGYGGVVALQDVSITARPGTITAVLGANGAGKTTLLATISGFVRPRQGRIKLDDTDLARRRPEEISRAGVAHVPEGQAVITELTVEENLRVGGLPRRGRPDRRSAPTRRFSSTVSSVITAWPSGTWPTPARTISSGRRRARSVSSSLIRPWRGRTNPLIVASWVVLPAPFAPRTAVIVPGLAVIESSWSASTPP